MNRLLIVDGHNLLFQMFFGMPSRIIGARGQAIQGVIGFVGAINRLADTYHPTHLLVMFDGEKHNPRKDMLEEYKANRIDYSEVPEEENPFSQLPLVYEALDYMGIKHTSVDLYTLHQFKQKIERPVTVFNGFDEMCLGGLAMGADGAIGSTYNFMGDKFIKIFNAFNAGDMETAQAIQTEANEIIAEMIKYTVLPCEKAIMTHLGIDCGPCRRPFLPLTKEADEAMARIAASLY